ncbi:Quercetin 2,3-dioxygenase [Pseudoalteromonas sp. THAF3]|uniref:Pirin family protein n=1 Tax=Pseudoalteromonas ruthenica TaxID=151081 RepID=A0A5S3Z1W5_9GAMM|nr:MULTISPECIES: pirin family protein [Pseudoalteromonas]MCG7571591.1 pirin family protein [Pseudoalteromonas sp. CNC9-20]QFU06310.1 Quercetin 2,3-dioxygenase [Pseudoalteromonas sp. THAF3]TLX52345.1 pirin family protein [Pseudoalteromonas ruthenica]TMP86001.1 pirin family protein [Pseudoalteromonas ruthenica]
MNYIRRAEQRGQVNLGWLQSQHSFSFGHYYDPQHMGLSTLRVINEDKVEPGQGFATHGHRDMEIISYVIEGALTHQDSQGNTFTLTAGEVQRMSAGSGIMHSEYNASQSEHAHFLQIWILPKFKGITPSYEQRRIPQQGAMTPLVTPQGEGNTLSINQQTRLSRLMLTAQQKFRLQSGTNLGYVHIVKGALTADGAHFSSGDGFALEREQSIELQAESALEALYFELP